MSSKFLMYAHLGVLILSSWYLFFWNSLEEDPIHASWNVLDHVQFLSRNVIQSILWHNEHMFAFVCESIEARNGWDIIHWRIGLFIELRFATFHPLLDWIKDLCSIGHSIGMGFPIPIIVMSYLCGYCARSGTEPYQNLTRESSRLGRRPNSFHRS